MSQDVSKMVVEARFDNAGFAEGVQETLNDLKKLDEATKIDNIGKTVAGIQDTLNGVDFSVMTEKIGIISNDFTFLGKVWDRTLGRMIDSAINWATNTTKALTIDPVSSGFTKYGEKMGSVQTIMNSTGESLETVNSVLADLNEYSDQTIYSFNDMTSSIGKFTNAGVKLKDAVSAIKGISNEAAISGANAADASRAMYNFAQALSSGNVKLIDWKSIENANMATKEFKTQLMETAVEVGTLTKKGEEYVSLTKDNNGHVSDAFTATSKFNDSLSAQWMTTEVLTKTLAKYADETTEVGKKGYAAAKEVKNFAQLMDVLKESVETGWSKTFEIIVGDFEESKALWTSVNEVVGGFLDSMAVARNTMFQTWKDAGGRNDLLEAFSNIYQYIKKITAKPVRIALTKKLFPIDMAQGLINVTKAFKDLTAGLNATHRIGRYVKYTVVALITPIKWIASAIGAIVFNLVPGLSKAVKPLAWFILYAFGKLGFYMQKMTPFVNGLIEKLGALSRIIGDKIGGALTWVGIKGQKLLKGAIKGISEFFKTKGGIGGLKDRLKGAFEGMKIDIKNPLKNAFNTTKLKRDVQLSWLDFTSSLSKNFTENFKLGEFLNEFGKTFSYFRNQIYGAIVFTKDFGSMFDRLGQILPNFKARIGSLFSESFRFTELINNTKTSLNLLTERIITYFKNASKLPELFNKIKVGLVTVNDAIFEATGINVIRGIKVIIALVKKVGVEIKKFGFILDAVSNFASKIVKAFNEFINIKGFVTDVSEAFEMFKNEIARVIETATSFDGLIDGVKKTFGAFWKVIVGAFKENIKLSGFFDAVKMAFRSMIVELVGGFKDLNIFGSISEKITVALKKLNDKIRDLTGIDFMSIGSHAVKIFALLGDAISKIVGFNLSNAFGTIKMGVDEAWESIKNFASGAKDSSSTFLDFVKKSLNFKGAFESIKMASRNFIIRLKSIAGSSENVEVRLQKIISAVKAFKDRIVDAVRSNLKFDAIFDKLKESFKKFLENVSGIKDINLPDLFDKAKQNAKKFGDWLSSKASSLFPKATEKIKDAFSNIPTSVDEFKKKFDELIDRIKNTDKFQAFLEILDSIKSKFENLEIVEKFSNTIESLKTKIDNIVSAIKNNEDFQKLGEIFKTFVDNVKNVDFTTPGTAISGIAESFKSLVESIKDFSLGKIDDMTKSISDLWDAVKGKTRDNGSHAEGLFEQVKESTKKALSGIFAGIMSFPWDQAFKIVKGIVVLYLLKESMELFAGIVTIFKTSSGVVGILKKTIKKFNSLLTETKWIVMAEALRTAAMGVLMIAGALFVLSTIPKQDLQNATVALGAIIILLSILAFAAALLQNMTRAKTDAEAAAEASKATNEALQGAVNGMKSVGEGIVGGISSIGKGLVDVAKVFATDITVAFKKFMGFLGFSSVLISLGALLATFAGIMLILLKLTPDQMITGAWRLVTILGILLGAVTILAVISKFLGSIGSFGEATVLLSLGSALKTLAKIVIMLGDLTWGQIGHALAVMSALTIMIMAIMFVARLCAGGGTVGLIKSLSVMALAFSFSVRLLVKPIQELGDIPKNQIDKALKILWGFVGMISALLIVSSLIQRFVSKGTMEFGAAIGGIVAISAAIWIMSKAMNNLADIPIGKVDGVITLLVALGLVLGGLLVIGALVSNFATSMAGLVVSILMLVLVASAIYIVSAALKNFAIAMEMLTDVAPAFETNIWSIMAILTAFIGVMAILGAIGMSPLGPGLIVIAAAFIIFAAAAWLAAEAATVMVNLLMTIPDGMEMSSEEIIKKGDVLANAVALAMYAAGKGIVMGIGFLLLGLISGLWEVIKAAWSMLKPAVEWLIDAILNYIGEVGVQKIKNAWNILWAEVSAGQLEMQAGNFESWGMMGLGKDLRKQAAEIREAAKAEADAAIDAIEARMAEREPEVEAATNGFAENVTDNVGTVMTDRMTKAGMEAPMAFSTSYKNSMDAQQPEMADSTSNALAAIYQTVFGKSNIPDADLSAYEASISNQIAEFDFSSEGSGAMGTFADGSESGIPDVIALFNQTGTDAAASLENPEEFMNSGNVDINAIVSAILGGQDEVYSAGNTTANAGAGGVSSARPGYVSSGGYLIDGIMVGAQNKAPALYSLMETIGANSKVHLDKGAQIGSPSKLFIQSGRWMMSGLVLGVAKYADIFYKKLRDVGAGSGPVMTNALTNLANINFDDLDIQPTVTPVLDLSGIRSGWADASSIFNGAQIGNVTAGLNVQSKIDDLDAYANRLSELNAKSNSDVLTALNRQYRQNEEILSAIRAGGKIYLNGRTLVGGIIEDVDNSLGSRARFKERGI